MYVPLSDDKHQFVQKVHSICANGHWEQGRNSNPVTMLPHATVVFHMQPFKYQSIMHKNHNAMFMINVHYIMYNLCEPMNIK